MNKIAGSCFDIKYGNIYLVACSPGDACKNKRFQQKQKKKYALRGNKVAYCTASKSEAVSSIQEMPNVYAVIWSSYYRLAIQSGWRSRQPAQHAGLWQGIPCLHSHQHYSWESRYTAWQCYKVHTMKSKRFLWHGLGICRRWWGCKGWAVDKAVRESTRDWVKSQAGSSIS